MARICHITMPNPTVRSIRPAIIGSVAASASNATIDLSARMERAFSQVGNVSGSRSEKMTISSNVSSGRPYTGSSRSMACPVESVASSGWVGSRALDLMDCIQAPPSVSCVYCRDAAPLNAGGRGSEQIADREIFRMKLADDLTTTKHKRAMADFRNFLEVR